MAQQHNRWERIAIAIDAINYIDESSDEDHHHMKNEKNRHNNEGNNIHIRLESSSLCHGETSLSSLFISPYAIELLSSTSTVGIVRTVVLNDTPTSSMTNDVLESTIPPTAQQRQQQQLIRVIKLHIQAANQPSQSYPETSTTTLSATENDLFHDIITGPSGIMVQVDYEVITTTTTPMKSTTTTTTTTKTPSNHDKQLLRIAKHHFMYKVLPFLSGQRRIIIAPFINTIDNVKLHRYVHCRSIHNNNNHNRYNNQKRIQCTTILPHEGAHAAFSIEGFRTFLLQQQQSNGGLSRNSPILDTNNNENGGIWNTQQMASPKVWSQFFIGSGYPIPQSLSEATQSFSTLTTHPSSSSHPIQQLVNRRMYWIHWERRMEEYQGNGTDADVVFEARYGLQYNMKVQVPDLQSQKHGISLNDLLPRNTNNDDNAPKSNQSDPFADRSTIEITASSKSHNDYIEWNPNVCTSPSSSTTITNEGKTMVCTIVSFDTISRTEPLFLIGKTESSGGVSNTNASDPNGVILSSPSGIQHYWKVQTHLYRPYHGQAYRGTYSGMIQNELMGCDGINVLVHQSFPAIMEPIWQSLHVRMFHTTMASSTNQTRHHPPDSINVAWHELNHHHVDFQKDGSFIIEIRHIVPSQSILEIVFDYEPKFINVDYFPADANHGFEIPPMIVHVLDLELDGTDTCHEILQQTYRDSIPIVTLYSNTLLLLAPLPDMSMPFNVLSFTCTFYVFVIGSLMNLLLKKVSAQMKAKISDTPKESKIQILKRSIRNKLQRVFSKVSMSGLKTKNIG